MHLDCNKVRGIDCSTGSLGHGISLAVGFALAGRVNGIDYMNYVITGDGELNEGSNWEAAMSAAQFKLSNVVVFVDINKCMIDGRVDDEMKVEPVDKKFEAFGFNVIRIDGHNMKELNDAIETAIKNHQDSGDKPTAICMDTFKGEGVDFMRDNYLWHYGSLDEEMVKTANASLDKYYAERCERAEKEA
jgi:transketolase